MKLVTRAEAGLRPPKSIVRLNMSSPSTAHWNGNRIVISGSTTWAHSRCASIVRGIQDFHMKPVSQGGRGWQDIAYNFIECPHGFTFECRGLNVANGANGTNAANRSSHAIMCLAGDGNAFPEEEKVGFRDCVRYISQRTASPDRCVGHRDHKATACPGNERYNWVRQGMPTSAVVPQPSNPTSPPGSAPSKYPTLRLGNSGEAVRRVQTIIRDKAGGDIVVDGQFGPRTKRRVTDVQRFFGLTADGVVGPKTWGILNFINATPPPNPYAEWIGKTKPTIKRGSTAASVKYLQDTINRKAGGGITVDGKFGPTTENRVKDVQRYFKLTADGIVGPKTWGIIDYLASL
jgi:peptidoglycan hydrolase-like protein with peptidoglycan-binding domain